MTAKQQNRGHETIYDRDKDKWFYSDNGLPADIERPCKRCNYFALTTGEDHCLKELSGCEGISNACCGHGNDENAYILLKDGRRFILDRRLSDDD